jgi:hypothetical protein
VFNAVLMDFDVEGRGVTGIEPVRRTWAPYAAHLGDELV